MFIGRKEVCVKSQQNHKSSAYTGKDNDQSICAAKSDGKGLGSVRTPASAGWLWCRTSKARVNLCCGSCRCGSGCGRTSGWRGTCSGKSRCIHPFRRLCATRVICLAGCLTGGVIIATLADALSAVLFALEVGDCQGVLGGIGRQSVLANAGVG